MIQEVSPITSKENHYKTMFEKANSKLQKRLEKFTLLAATGNKYAVALINELCQRPDVIGIDPEKLRPHLEVAPEEPHDPFNTVLVAILFKLKQLALYEEPEEGRALVMATDVAYVDEHDIVHGKPARTHETNEYRKFTRTNADGKTEEVTIPQHIIDRYTQPGGFKARWHVGMGTQVLRSKKLTGRQRHPQPAVAMVEIEAQYPELTEEDVVKYYAEWSSSGMMLAELSQELEATGRDTVEFFMSNVGSEEKVPVSYEDAILMLVVKKVIPPYFLNQLLKKKDAQKIVVAPNNPEPKLRSRGSKRIDLVNLTFIRELAKAV
jgi:hypothetical protein